MVGRGSGKGVEESGSGGKGGCGGRKWTEERGGGGRKDVGKGGGCGRKLGGLVGKYVLH